MRGRSLFRTMRPLIVACGFALQIVPRPVCVFLWPLIQSVPWLVGIGLRYVWLKRLAARVGENVFIGRDVEIYGWNSLSIADHVSIHRGSYLDASGGIQIGNNVSIAHSCSILSAEHTWDDDSIPIRDSPLRYAAVQIDDDVWIGCGVRILKGVTLGRRVVVAAGAVVTRSVSGGRVVAGIPARPIRLVQ